MDMNTIRIAVTLVTMAAFAAVVLWAYAPSRKARLESVARDVVEDSE